MKWIEIEPESFINLDRFAEIGFLLDEAGSFTVTCLDSKNLLKSYEYGMVDVGAFTWDRVPQAVVMDIRHKLLE